MKINRLSSYDQTHLSICPVLMELCLPYGETHKPYDQTHGDYGQAHALLALLFAHKCFDRRLLQAGARLGDPSIWYGLWFGRL